MSTFYARNTVSQTAQFGYFVGLIELINAGMMIARPIVSGFYRMHRPPVRAGPLFRQGRRATLDEKFTQKDPHPLSNT